MQHVALVTDSTSDIPPKLAAQLGVFVVPASFAFDDQRYLEGDLELAAYYARLRAGQRAPRTFGAAEAAFRGAYTAALRHAESVVCLVTPFDVNASFTTAAAAMLAVQDELTGAAIKVVNPGVGSTGLCSLLVSLSRGIARGWRCEDVLTAVDELGPRCDALFVPETAVWLERAGRLALLEERLGEVGDNVPVVRIGTRITGVALAGGLDEAIEVAVATATARAGDAGSLVITISHADAPQRAEQVTKATHSRWPAAEVIVTTLSPTIGAQLGPGAIGIGVAPLLPATEDDLA